MKRTFASLAAMALLAAPAFMASGVLVGEALAQSRGGAFQDEQASARWKKRTWPALKKSAARKAG